jgi:hypothetical protein
LIKLKKILSEYFYYEQILFQAGREAINSFTRAAMHPWPELPYFYDNLAFFLTVSRKCFYIPAGQDYFSSKLKQRL